MKILLSFIFLASASFAQTAITTYTLTEQDCSPMSPLMLFRPPGFVCVPSTTILVTGGAEGYEVEVQYQRSGGVIATEKAFIRADQFQQATWVTYEKGVKILRVTAMPFHQGTLPTTVVF